MFPSHVNLRSKQSAYPSDRNTGYKNLYANSYNFAPYVDKICECIGVNKLKRLYSSVYGKEKTLGEIFKRNL